MIAERLLNVARCPSSPQIPSLDTSPTMLFLLILVHLLTKNRSAAPMQSLDQMARPATDVDDALRL